MQNKLITAVLLAVASIHCFSQTPLDGVLKDKANVAKDKAKEKARQKALEGLEKHKKEYDESNFNYAICFLDNSGLFEAEEKGSSLNSLLINSAKLANNEEKNTEDRAYTNLKNGELLLASNKYYLAEQSFKLAKLLYEEDGKRNTLNYAQTLGNLGLLYQSRGRFTKAKQFTEEALLLREKLGNQGMLLASVNNMAVLRKETGLYTEAESGFKKGLEMASLSGDRLARALLSNNLAMTYVDMNKLRDAETQMVGAITDASSVLKDNAGNYIKLQINLANIYRLEKKYTNAEDLYLLAIKNKEKKLGTHPDLAHLKQGLAQLYLEMGKTSDVEKLLKNAYDIDRRKLGEKNPATLAIQQDLANYYRLSGNAEKALDLMGKVVGLKKEIYGEGHPSYIQALEDLALAQWQNNRLADTRNNYRIVIASTLDYIHRFFNALNEGEKALYWDKTSARLQRFYAFAGSHASTDMDLAEQFYNTVINTKGFLLSGSSKIRSIIANGSNEALKTTYTHWLETKEQLNTAYQLSKEELAEEHINVDSLEARANELERELSQKSAEFKLSADEKPVTYQQLQKLLLKNEAAVEIVELNTYANGFTGDGAYTALVLTTAGIRLVPLGDAATLQKAVSDFREKTTHLQAEDEAYGFTWKPLDEALKGISKIYLSLDGVFHQLSVNALKDASGVYLIDKYNLLFVGNTKDLVDLKQRESKAAKPVTAFLIGNPLYGKNGAIEQLPGTEAEVKSIAKLLTGVKVKTTALYGTNATETKLKSVSSPGILHIATHGYFLSDLSKIETRKVLGVDVGAARENPLLRSGLLLANCENVFEENYRPSTTSENGILTAYEALSLDLGKTDIVVLSACETGLGSVKQGEGVYGLQRAFLIAGAKSVIMSLWSVSDEATMKLMTLFYSSYSKTGNKTQAFSEAIKQLKLKYKQPFYWGAFVMLSK